MESSTGVIVALTTLFSTFLGLVVAWANSVMTGMQKRIESLEDTVSNCHKDRADQNLVIGGLKSTVENLQDQIKYSVEKRRHHDAHEGEYQR